MFHEIQKKTNIDIMGFIRGERRPAPFVARDGPEVFLEGAGKKKFVNCFSIDNMDIDA